MKLPVSEFLPEPAFGSLPRLPWSVQEFCLDSRGEVPAWQPAKDLAHLHIPVIVASLWQRLLAAVREPAQVGIVDGRRVVQVLGTARLTCESGSAFSVKVRRCVDGAMQWVEVPPAEIVVTALPARWIWLGLVRQAAVVELARHLRRDGEPANTAELDRYAVALFDHFRRALVRHADLRVMRQRVSAALALNPDALRIAHRLMNLLPDSGMVRLSYYNTVIRNLEAFKALEREAPQLIPLYSAVVDRPDVDQAVPPAQALRAHLMSADLTPRTWRLVLKAGPRLLLPVRDFYKGEARTAMLDYLRILEALGLDREPSSALIWGILNRFANPGWRFERHIGQIRHVADQFGHAARTFIRLASPAAREQDLAAVLEWMERAKPKLDKSQRRAGWPWLLKNAEAWLSRQRLVLESKGDRWQLPFAKMTIGTCVLQPIDSATGLWDEGRAMHHCVFDYANSCAKGAALIVSARSDADHSRRLATALFAFDGSRWRCEQVRGPLNRDPDQRAVEALRKLTGLMNEQTAHRQDVARPRPTGATWQAQLREPSPQMRPRQMPRSAQLVAQLGWSSSPVHCCIKRYFLSMNRQHNMWLLWAQRYDDNWECWLSPKIVAHAVRQRVGRLQAARALLNLAWTEDWAAQHLGRFDEVTEEGLLSEQELTTIANAHWPDTESGTQ